MKQGRPEKNNELRLKGQLSDMKTLTPSKLFGTNVRRYEILRRSSLESRQSAPVTQEVLGLVAYQSSACSNTDLFARKNALKIRRESDL